MKVYKVKHFLKIFKYKVITVCSFPHFWICALIMLLQIVSLFISYNLYQVQQDFWSSIFANIFAGLLTGLIICLLSGVKQLYVAKARNKKNWLEHIRSMIGDYNELYNELKIKSVLEGILNSGGTDFESSYLDLGKLLGYSSHNSDDKAAPDPYWIINDSLCIVSEDKIYEDERKEIPVKDVSQAMRHEMWIREHVKTLRDDAEIITVFISNSVCIENEARTFCHNIYYCNRKELFTWASNALNCLRQAKNLFSEAGNSEWRTTVYELFSVNKVNPSDFIKLITETKLSDL